MTTELSKHTAPSRCTALACCVGALSLALATPLRADGPQVAWEPVTNAELALKAAKVDPAAGVEALFWHVYVADDVRNGEVQRVLYHYVRLKIFNEQGAKAVSNIELPYDDDNPVAEIHARTTKPDGTVVELSKNAVHDRDVLRAGRFKQKMRSFAIPAVEPGAIVEYRYRETRLKSNVRYLRLQFQLDYPAEKVTYYLKPFDWADRAGYTMSVRAFNCSPSLPKPDNQGYSEISLENVPAFNEEPMMPAPPNVRAWVLVYYHEGTPKDPDKYWNDQGRRVYSNLKPALSLNGDMKAVVDKALEGVHEEDKPAALLRCVRANIRGIFDDGVTESERARILKSLPKTHSRTAADIFKSGIALPNEMNIVFAAMAAYAHMDAYPALVGDRGDLLFEKSLMDSYFLDNIDIAVKTPNGWRLYDASAGLLPAGMVSWREEGVAFLLCNPHHAEFQFSQVSEPEASASLRVARMKLDESGTLAGYVEERYTGHAAFDHRYEWRRESRDQLNERLKEALTHAFPKADISELHVINVDKPDEVLAVRYRIRIPDYAERTGKRMLIQPLLFERSHPAMFSASSRKYDILLRYAWRDLDQVVIELPPGFELDHPHPPSSLDFGEPGTYKLTVGLTKNHELAAIRELTFGSHGHLVYPVSVYPQLKNAFDEVHERDNVMVVLKRTPPAQATGGQK